MPIKPLSPMTEAIQRRCVEAISALIATGKITGVQPFCENYGLHRVKYINLRLYYTSGKKIAYKTIDLDALTYLVRDYNVSADWLLTGKGGTMGMFRSPSN